MAEPKRVWIDIEQMSSSGLALFSTEPSPRSDEEGAPYVSVSYLLSKEAADRAAAGVMERRREDGTPSRLTFQTCNDKTKQMYLNIARAALEAALKEGS